MTDDEPIGVSQRLGEQGELRDFSRERRETLRVFPVAMILVSFSGSIPKRRRASRKVMSEVVPRRLTPP